VAVAELGAMAVAELVSDGCRRIGDRWLSLNW
jgi:hypothetical protein